jgi:anti-sigma factor RsiW
MTCTQVARLADRFVDGRLDEARAADLERHARSCGACARLLADARRVGRFLSGEATAARAPRGFADRVMDRVLRETLWKPAEARVRAAPSGIPARGYRRLGLCVMLGAATLAGCLVVPRSVLPMLDGPAASNGASIVVKNVLAGADSAVKGMLTGEGGSR